MEVLDTLFDNAFFRLPMLEAMMYLFVVMCIAASVIGMWKRFVGTSSGSAEQFELRKAA